MTTGPILGKAIKYTVPIILTGVLQLLFNAADLVVVGRFCGSVSVGAVGATSSLINLLVNLFMGVSVGAGVVTAQALGAGRDNDVHRAVHTAIPTAVIGGAILTVIGVLFAEDFLSLMATPEDVIELSTVYVRIYFCGITSSIVYNFGAAILRAAGETKKPLYYLTASGILNVLLNCFFVVVFDMDVAGVALATAISQTLSAVLVLFELCRRRDCCKLELKKLRIHKKSLAGMLKVGVPAGIQGSIFSISNVIIQSSVNSFGSVVISGSAAGGNIEGFVYIIMNSFYQTALNFTGQNYGAGEYRRIGKIMRVCLMSVTVAGLTAGTLVYIFAEPLLSIYITDSAEAIGYGITRLTYICLPYFLCGCMEVMTGLIRGMGVSLAPMFVSIVGVCGIRITWIFTIFGNPRFHTLESLFISYPISWIVTFLVHSAVFFVLYSRLKKPIKHNKEPSC